MPAEANVIGAEALRVIEMHAKTKEAAAALPQVAMKGVRAASLLAPIDCPLDEAIRPSKGQIFVGDRVAYIRSSGTVAFGQKGTVTSVFRGRAEVLFDETFLSGTTLNSRIEGFRGATLEEWTLLNLSKRELVKDRRSEAAGKNKKKAAVKPKKQSANPFAAFDDE